VTRFVLDASVAAKWYLPAAGEPFAEEALDVLRRYSRGEFAFVVPGLFWAEFGNTLWKAVRRGRWTRADAGIAIVAMRERNLPTVPSASLLEEAFHIAAAFDRSVYDSLYVALALAAKAQFLTADERLAHALAAHLPVKWLGAV
jgi:predicted nucleic acid-binding protein